MPGRESLGLRGDCRAGNCELAILTIESAGVHVIVHWIYDAWVDAREQHGLVGRPLLRPCTGASENERPPYPSQQTEKAAPCSCVGGRIRDLAGADSSCVWMRNHSV